MRRCLRALPLVLLTTLLPLAPAAAWNQQAALTAAARAWVQQHAGNLPGTPQVSVAQHRGELLPCDRIEPISQPPGRLRPRQSVGLRCQGPAHWTAYVQVSLSLPGSYPVLARAVAADQRIGPGDLDTREGDLLTLPPDTVFSGADLIGQIAMRRLPAGRPVRTDALRSPDSIRRGQTVRLEARGSGFVATSEGQAMADAPPGGLVQVRTPSGQVITGTVKDGNTVTVTF